MTVPAPNLAIGLLTRGVSFNPRFVHPFRLPCWPTFRGPSSSGFYLQLPGGGWVVPPVRRANDPAAYRLRVIRGEHFLREGDRTICAVGFRGAPASLWEEAPGGAAFGEFIAPLPDTIVVNLSPACDLAFAGDHRCAFCRLEGTGVRDTRLTDVAAALRRWGGGKPVHLFSCYRHHPAGERVLAAAEMIAGTMGLKLSLEIPPLGDLSLYRALAGKGASQIIVDLDAIDAGRFTARCPAREAASSYGALEGEIETGLGVFGKGNVGVRIILLPEDVDDASKVLLRLAAAGAVPILLPAPSGDGEWGRLADSLGRLAARIAAKTGGRTLPIDPYRGFAIPSDGVAAPIPWYRRLLSLFGLGKG